MKMRAIRRRLNFMVYSKGVWVDLQGNYGPNVRGSTHSSRRIRIKHHVPGFIFGGFKYSKRLFKTRSLPVNWMEIAASSDFYPIERYPGIWDVFDREAGDRHHNLHRNKRHAWLECYRAAFERAAWIDGAA